MTTYILSLSFLIVVCALLMIIDTIQCKKIREISGQRDAYAWKLIKTERELNLLNNSIVTIEDELPKKISTAAIGMKLSNEMLSYVDVDLDGNKLKARMIAPSCSIEDYLAEHPEEESKENENLKEA